jgi:CID domain
MADELRDRLRRVDGSAPAIQGAANAMMKHYDRSALTAVTEWRNALQTASQDQILPLLYVANEVLQTSKRNRGNRFLEAFSPVLGQSLVYMAKQLRTGTEKIRRTVKIWGDRRVFSIRFVNDLLGGLEPYRPGNDQPAEVNTLVDSDGEGAVFSPPTAAPASSDATSQSNDVVDGSATSHDDIMDILEAHDAGGDDNYDDDDDDMFADESERQKLEIEVDVDAMTANASPIRTQKRRRSSASHGTHGKRQKILSITNFLDIWNQLVENEQKFEIAQHVLKRIEDNIAATPDDDLTNLVGDALQQAVKQNDADQRSMATQKRLLHALANERHALELEVVRYLPWLEASLQHDDEDLILCKTLEEKIIQFGEFTFALVCCSTIGSVLLMNRTHFISRFTRTAKQNQFV